MAVTAVRFGIHEGTKEELIKYGVGAMGAFAGFGISEFTGEFITTYAKLSGAKKTIAKIMTRLLIFAIAFGASLYVPAGWLTWLIAGAGLGAFSGIFLDIYEHFYPEGLKGTAQKAALSLEAGSFRAA